MTKNVDEACAYVKRFIQKLRRVRMLQGAKFIFIPENNNADAFKLSQAARRADANLFIMREGRGRQRNFVGVYKDDVITDFMAGNMNNLLIQDLIQYHEEMVTTIDGNTPDKMKAKFEHQLANYREEREVSATGKLKRRLHGKSATESDDLLIAVMTLAYWSKHWKKSVQYRQFAVHH